MTRRARRETPDTIPVPFQTMHEITEVPPPPEAAPAIDLATLLDTLRASARDVLTVRMRPATPAAEGEIAELAEELARNAAQELGLLLGL